MKSPYLKMFLFILCCISLNGCGLAQRIITAPVRILTQDNTHSPASERNTALAFHGDNISGEDSYDISYEEK